MQTTTTLPDLSSDYPITQEQIASFRQNGHVLLRGIVSAEEMAAYRPIINNAVKRLNTQHLPLEQRDTYGKAFLQIHNLWAQDDLAKKFVLSRRFAKIAADLMGVDGIRLYHDQALYKEAGGGKTPWHQDQYYWPLDTNHTVTMWMPLVDVPIERGALTFASGTHVNGAQEAIALSDESEAYFAKLVEEKGYPSCVEPLVTGDATFHLGWTLHHAPGNDTDTLREVMTIIYMEDGVKLLQPDNPGRQDDLQWWFPGKKPGDLAASELNPLLYTRTSDTK